MPAQSRGTWSSSTTGGRCTSDSAFTIVNPASGASHLNHAVSFQSRIAYRATGIIDRIQGTDFNPTISSGFVGQLFGHYIRNATKAAGATIDQQVAVWVENLTAGQNNFSFYGQGGSFYNNGSMQIAGALTGATSITANGQASAQCFNATGSIAEFRTGGGVAIAGANGAAAYATVRAYSNAAGTAKGLSLNPTGGQVLVGAAVPVSGGALEVAGGAITPSADNTQDLGKASYRFGTVYAGTGTINTSDARAKKNIGAIPDSWLDAWAQVEHRRFKYRGGKRWHIGLIAQEVHEAFAKEGIDAFEIGLLCYDQWDEQTVQEQRPVTRTRKVQAVETEAYDATERQPKVDAAGRVVLAKIENDDGSTGHVIEQEDVLVTRHRLVMREVDESYDDVEPTGKHIVTTKAGDRWGLRENECAMIEAAYQRRQMARLEACLADLTAQRSS